MELRQLRYFTVLAETLHFGRAAAAVHLAPSAFSTTIARLERELGVSLLERTSRAVRLTEAGEAFLPRALALLVDAEQAVAVARAHAVDREATLIIGLHDEGAAELNTPILAALRARLPNVRIAYRPLPYTAHRSALVRGEVDAVIGMREVLDLDDAVCEPLFDDGRVVMLARNHPLADAASLTVADVLDERHVEGPPEIRRLNDHFRLAAERNGDACRAAGPHVTSMLEILQQVGSGSGVSTVTSAVERFFPYPDVVYRPLSGASPSTVCLLTRPGDTRATTRVLTETVPDTARRLLDLVPGARTPGPDAVTPG